MVVTDIASQAAEGLKVVDEIRGMGATAIFLDLDVTKEEDWKRVHDEVERKFGCLDVLVNNAGGALPEGTPDDMDFSPNGPWRRTLALNLDGVAMGVKYGIKLMRKSKSTERKSIINISSTAGLKGIIGSYAYGAAKGAVNIYSKSVAIYASRFGINVK